MPSPTRPFVRRRSDRLLTKQRNDELFSSCYGPMGMFCLLPIELHHGILNNLTHSDLATLSTSSHTFASVVRNYLVSAKHLETLLFPFVENSGRQQWPHVISLVTEQFFSLGNLLRSVACLMQTKEKFRLLTAILSKLQSVHTMILSQSGSSAAYSCFGALLKQLVRNWSFSDKRSVFQLIWQEACLESRCQQVFSTAAGSLPLLELDLRLLIRNVFLRHDDLTEAASSRQMQLPDDFLCWLTLLLKSWPLVNQARLLVMLFGPLHHSTGVVHWRKLCSAFNVSGCSKQDLAELAVVLSGLYSANGQTKGAEKPSSHHLRWIPDQVVSIVDETTALPHGWSLDNMGQLMQLLSRPLTVNLLQCYAANGRLSELAHLVLHLAIVCADDDSNHLGRTTNQECAGGLSYFIHILHDVMAIFQMSVRKQFLRQLFVTWQEHIMDTFHMTEDPNQMNLAVCRMTKMCEVLSHQLFINN